MPQLKNLDHHHHPPPPLTLPPNHVASTPRLWVHHYPPALQSLGQSVAWSMHKSQVVSQDQQL